MPAIDSFNKTKHLISNQASNTIPSQVVHLWCMHTKNLASYAQCLQHHVNSLSSLDEQRFHAYKQLEQRLTFLASRVLLKTLLSQYHPCYEPWQWQLGFSAFDKPHIQQPHSLLQFNISHTQGMIVIAFTSCAAIGCDVEHLLRCVPRESLSKRYFSPYEQRALQHGIPQEQQHRFFALWTLKEACVKACGLGLRLPLPALSFAVTQPLTSPQMAQFYSSDSRVNALHWQLWHIPLSDEHTAAVGIAAPTPSPLDIQVFSLDVASLVSQESFGTVCVQ